ncbi:PDR/VanB family oxidoreductase [Roseixanthobacter glucoisosaccharinicivorans]|uniref:PDR/VanB family oxidoreductase n=1 Tax=Roseixanthobacter glucoisosaccharinicivorans TaxID=3119923 RepID=UPI0037277ADD
MSRTIRTVVTEITPAGAGVKRFVLQDPEGWNLPRFKPGAHVDLCLPGGTLRTYSLCNPPTEGDRYVVAVKREPKGRGGSIQMHDTLQVGTEIGVSVPRGGVPVPAGRLIFIAGGIGVTPFLSAAAALVKQGRTDFTLHLLARGAPPLADLLTPLAGQAELVIHDTAAAPRPDLAALLGAPRPGVMVACCGPQGMTDAFEAATQDWPADQVHVERFTPPPVVLDPRALPYTLVLARSGREIDVPLGVSMLDALERNGVRVPNSCGGGICGACKIEWTQGTPIHRDRFLSPQDRTHALMACVALSAEDRLTIDL